MPNVQEASQENTSLKKVFRDGPTNRSSQMINRPVVPGGTWVCKNCGTNNSINYGQCKKCGKSRS